MTTDTPSPAEFYATARGAVAARAVRQRLAAMWPALDAQSVLGVGHAQPYLRLWRERAYRCVALGPAPLAAPAMRWPAGAPNLVCAAEEDALPFPDLSFDRVLIVHGLETAGRARAMLREVWRVLRDDGRLIVVAPNRRGMWAHVDSTPFGQGQPYSAGQIGRLLTDCLFRVERREAALFIPPARLRLVLRAAPLIEDAGRVLAPGLAGLIMAEAAKDAYAALPVAAPARRRVFLPEAA